MGKSLLEKQIKKVKENYPKEEFIERLLEEIAFTYEDLLDQQKFKDNSIRMMSEDMLSFYKEAEEKKEAFISTILGKIVDGVITCDSKGKIIAVNHSAEAILNRQEKDLLEFDISEVLTDFDSFDEFISLYRKSLEHKESQVEVALNGKGNPRVPCELSVSQFDIDEVSYIVIFRDITERKKAEAMILTAKEKAEEEAQAKAEFLSTMSHEIRTPMNSIVGITNILQSEETDEEKMRMLDTLKFSSEHLLALINDILDFSKIEAGKIEFENIDFNLKRVAKNIVEACKFKVEKKPVDVLFEWDHNLPKYVIGDQSRLAQILTNLIGNAVKFTSEGSVTTRLSLLEELNNSVKVRFEVIDTGIGIPKDKQEQIFESYSQSSADTSRKYGGTGLGLAITKRLVELQDSYIQLDSEEGKGSNFYFDLTLKKSSKRLMHNEAISPDDLLDETELAGLRLLLVEDNPLNQFVAQKDTGQMEL